MNDKFKNNLISKIYNLESELSERNILIDNLKEQNKNLKHIINCNKTNEINDEIIQENPLEKILLNEKNINSNKNLDNENFNIYSITPIKNNHLIKPEAYQRKKYSYKEKINSNKKDKNIYENLQLNSTQNFTNEINFKAVNTSSEISLNKTYDYSNNIYLPTFESLNIVNEKNENENSNSDNEKEKLIQDKEISKKEIYIDKNKEDKDQIIKKELEMHKQKLKDVLILNQIKDSFLSLSSADNSLNNSFNNSRSNSNNKINNEEKIKSPKIEEEIRKPRIIRKKRVNSMDENISDFMKKEFQNKFSYENDNKFIIDFNKKEKTGENFSLGNSPEQIKPKKQLNLNLISEDHTNIDNIKISNSPINDEDMKVDLKSEMKNIVDNSSTLGDYFTYPSNRNLENKEKENNLNKLDIMTKEKINENQIIDFNNTKYDLKSPRNLENSKKYLNDRYPISPVKRNIQRCSSMVLQLNKNKEDIKNIEMIDNDISTEPNYINSNKFKLEKLSFDVNFENERLNETSKNKDINPEIIMNLVNNNKKFGDDLDYNNNENENSDLNFSFHNSSNCRIQIEVSDSNKKDEDFMKYDSHCDKEKERDSEKKKNTSFNLNPNQNINNLNQKEKNPNLNLPPLLKDKDRRNNSQINLNSNKNLNTKIKKEKDKDIENPLKSKSRNSTYITYNNNINNINPPLTLNSSRSTTNINPNFNKSKKSLYNNHSNINSNSGKLDTFESNDNRNPSNNSKVNNNSSKIKKYSENIKLINENNIKKQKKKEESNESNLQFTLSDNKTNPKEKKVSNKRNSLIKNNHKEKDQKENFTKKKLNQQFPQNQKIKNSEKILKENFERIKNFQNKFSNSSCDLKNEIYLNVNKDSVFSLRPDENLEISDVIETQENENFINFTSCGYDSSNKKKFLENENKEIVEGKMNREFSIKNFKNFDENEKIKLESFSSKSKSLVSFEKLGKGKNLNISINNPNYEKKDYKKLNIPNNKKENYDNINSLSKEEKIKLGKITQKIVNKNTNESINSESCKGNNNNNSINLNNNNNINNNNISMNTTTEGSASMYVDSDKPVAYSTRLLAKYYKHIDNYNKKIQGNLKSKPNNKKTNHESNNSNKFSQKK